MRLFNRKAKQAPVPKRLLWSEDLWREATGSAGTNDFHALVMVRSLRVEAAWRHGSRTLRTVMEFVGRLGCEPGSMVEHIKGSVTLNTDPTAPETRYAWPDSTGIAFTGEYDHGGLAVPIFSVSIWTEKVGAEAFERAFDRALATGHDHLPVWVDGQRRAAPSLDGGRFSVIQPLSAIRFGHHLALKAGRS